MVNDCSTGKVVGLRTYYFSGAHPRPSCAALDVAAPGHGKPCRLSCGSARPALLGMAPGPRMAPPGYRLSRPPSRCVTWRRCGGLCGVACVCLMLLCPSGGKRQAPRQNAWVPAVEVSERDRIQIPFPLSPTLPRKAGRKKADHRTKGRTGDKKDRSSSRGGGNVENWWNLWGNQEEKRTPLKNQRGAENRLGKLEQMFLTHRQEGGKIPWRKALI